MRGEVKNAYALVRPPGHHAVPDLGMGFCLFGNVGVAIRHAQATYGLKRVATVDWDVHHGNGTQAMFYRDPSVLTISLHQDNLFPADWEAARRTAKPRAKDLTSTFPCRLDAATGPMSKPCAAS